MMLRAAFVPPESAVVELRVLAGRLSVLPGVRPEPPERLDVRIAGLGNVVEGDARRLAEAIERELRLPEPPVVRCAGVRLLDSGEVVVDLTGDVETLRSTVRALGKAAERVNLYVDRRSFRAAIVVATVEAQRPGSRVAAALAGAAGWEGSDWAVSEVALLKTRWGAGHPGNDLLGVVPIIADPATLLE